MDGEEFMICDEGVEMRVRQVSINNQTIYRINLPGKGYLVLTRALNAESNWFWTSIPEGRQKEAGKFGLLIEDHLRSI